MSEVAELRIDGTVARITLCNVAKRNCINLGLAERLQGLLRDARQARVILLSAEGPVFSSGVDLSAAPADNRQAKAILDRLVVESHCPWIARIDGGVIGLGIPLAASCHVSIATETSWWWLPELPKLGRMPWGVMEDLGDLVGAPALMGAMASAERLTSAQAYAAGMVSLVTPGHAIDAVLERTLDNLSQIGDAARDEITQWWRARKQRRMIPG